MRQKGGDSNLKFQRQFFKQTPRHQTSEKKSIEKDRTDYASKYPTANTLFNAKAIGKIDPIATALLATTIVATHMPKDKFRP